MLLDKPKNVQQVIDAIHERRLWRLSREEWLQRIQALRVTVDQLHPAVQASHTNGGTLPGFDVLAQQSVEQLLAYLRPAGPDESWWKREFSGLVGLSQFTRVECSIAKRAVTFMATTRPVIMDRSAWELPELNLGPFKTYISLRAGGYVPRVSVQVRPLSPIFSVNEVTAPHPHVLKTALCAGGAGPGITRAAETGRLVDAFLTINNLLMTYNAGSAYAKIEVWDGVRCPKCATVNARNTSFSAYSCRVCDKEGCPSCTAQLKCSCGGVKHFGCSRLTKACDGDAAGRKCIAYACEVCGELDLAHAQLRCSACARSFIHDETEATAVTKPEPEPEPEPEPIGMGYEP